MSPAGHCVLQSFDFLLRERPDGSRRQVAEAHGADGDSFQALHFVADAGQQAADFAVAAFVEHQFEDGRPFAPAFDADVPGVRETFSKMDAAMELGEDVALDLAGDLHLVDFFDAVARVRETVGQLAIVGDDDEAFGRDVEPADGKHARPVRRQQVDDARPAGRVAGRRNNADGLVHREVRELGPRQGLAIDSDFLFLRVDARAKLRDHFAIDFDAAFAHQFFAFAPAGNAGLGQDLLQALAGPRAWMLVARTFVTLTRRAE
jgi:hypothetical protein